MIKTFNKIGKKGNSPNFINVCLEESATNIILKVEDSKSIFSLRSGMRQRC